ncbi:MAG: hypothetical protein DRI71_04250 [Bacteroidetes bacterium]|nr:MAG: hypothetical protein DRI71_04250 [Bacteroidota bacterium]
MKKISQLLLVATVFVGLTACTDNGVETPPPNTEANVLSGAISENMTLTPDIIWEIDGKTYVQTGITLTIEAGTIIKGRTGIESNASALIIARGGKINAQGTAAAPIIFTSLEDNIAVGQLAGTNLGAEDKELWGGLIILGNAPISAENGDTETQIEGIPAEEEYGKYGGTNATDDSGVLKYVSFRHGGVSIGDGNEINGLTLGGVGSATTIDHVEIFATLDDGIEFFGGTVNVTNLIISYQGDDGVDIDQNYAGTVTNFVVMHGGNDTDEGLEIDGPEGSTYTDGLFTLKNGSVMSMGGAKSGTPADLKSGAQGNIDNVVFSNYAVDADMVKIRSSYDDANSCSVKTDAYTHLTNTSASLKLITSEFMGIKVYTKSDACSVLTDDQLAAEMAAISSGNATGADKSAFSAWTLASIKGMLN